MTEAARLLEVADPRNADSVFKAGATAVRKGLAAEALPLVEAGVANHPDDARMWQVLGLAYRQLEDLAPAVEALRKAADLAPSDPLIAHTHARAMLEAGLPATGLFDRAHLLAPNDGSVLLGRVAALFAEGRLDDAVIGLEDQLRRNPGWLPGHALVARLRWLRGDRGSFASSFEQALRTAPRDVALWREWIETLIHADRFDDALAVLARGREAAGPHEIFDLLETICMAEKGETGAADGLFGKLGPIRHVLLAVRYMRHLLRAGRPDEAASFVEPWLSGQDANLLWPYASLAWRLTGDPRWAWLEGDPALIGIYDIRDRIPSLDALAERLRALHHALGQPLEQSVRGGTQTDGPLFARIEPEIRSLRAAIVETVERHIAQLPPFRPGHPMLIARRAPIRFAGSWSIRLAGEGYHVNHLHPAGWISSAFYVALPEAGMGDSEHAGWLSLGEATELGLDLPPIRLVEPRPGRLVLFPSTMWHGTRPFAAGERLTVAFDVAPPG